MYNFSQICLYLIHAYYIGTAVRLGLVQTCIFASQNILKGSSCGEGKGLTKSSIQANELHIFQPIFRQKGT